MHNEKPLIDWRRFAMLAITLLLIVGTSPAQAADRKPLVMDPWVREAPPAMKMHAAYLVLMNPAVTPISVIGVTSPQYKKAELHQSKVEGGIATMTKQDQITIPAKSKLTMSPGDFHVMLMHPKKPIRAGDTVSITLNFADGSTIAFDAPVKKASGMHKSMGQDKPHTH